MSHGASARAMAEARAGATRGGPWRVAAEEVRAAWRTRQISLKAMTVPVMAALKIIGNTDGGKASAKHLKAERHSASGSEARVPMTRGQISRWNAGIVTKGHGEEEGI